MRYLSLFSGIEAATCAWHPLGWECAAVAEIEPFPCAVLAAHYPNVPNLGDVTQITEEQIAALGHIDLVVFGSPCQDLSVAGKRAGLQGERSGLFYTAVKIVRWARRNNGTRFALWENVPGAFSSNAGADFGVVVSELVGAAGVTVPPKGWGTEGALLGQEGMVEWSTLDAQWFGVAQRRRRVFAFADFGDWAGRCPVLLEPESLRGDSAPSREPGQSVAGCAEDGARRSGEEGCERSGLTHAPETARCIATREGHSLDFETTTMVAHSLRAEGFDASEDGTGRGTPLVPIVMPTMRAGAPGNSAGHGARSGDNKDEYIVPVLGFNHNAQVAQVRRLTPRECERLQGFPDDYTLVTYRGKPAADGPRYKALGNSMCTRVMAWIGRRIDLISVFQ